MARTATIGALGLVLLLAGCGSSAATPHFAARANAVCAEADAEVQALPARRSDSLRSLAAQARSEIPIVRREVSQLARLTAPSSERAPFATAISSVRAELALIGKLITAVHARDRHRIASLAEQGSTIDAQAKTATTELGLPSCAAGAQPAGRS